MAKAKPSTFNALNDILLTAEGGLSMKQIRYKAKRKTGKDVSERTIRRHLKVLKTDGGFQIVVTKKDGVYYHEAVIPRPPDQVLTPSGIVPAASLPTFRPITFGRPTSNVPAPVGPEPAPKQVAGSRAAQAFIDSLQGTT